MFKKPSIATILAVLIAIFMATFFCPTPTYASESSIIVSPLYQNMVLVPGEKVSGSYTIYSQVGSDTPTEFELYVAPFWADENNEVSYDNHGDYNQMSDWITLEKTFYKIEPNEEAVIHFDIDVPANAVAGGQYASIIARVAPREKGMITEVFQIAHLIYAEVAGQIVRSGEISDLTLTSFITSGKVTGSVFVRNDGNVHSKAKQILTIYPLFGEEELYTNEETPQENIVMPNATRYTNITWGDTPSAGIFRASYTVEYEGVKKELSKVVIVCPIWLLIISTLIIVTILFLIIRKIFARKPEISYP